MSGGGTGGHIIPNIALINDLRERYAHTGKLSILYIGTRRGMERNLIQPLKIKYASIMAGKLRRYLSFKNLVDFFKVPLGILQSLFILARFKPSVVFCKGGYVCFPVAVAARILRVPVILHESDVVPGLANKLSARFANKICVSFAQSVKYFPANKTVVTGNPLRRELVFGNADDGRAFTGLNERLPILLVFGGSQGAQYINELVRDNLDALLSRYQVVHICGEQDIQSPDAPLKLLKQENRLNIKRYRPFTFVGREMKDLYALCDLIVSRAGAITLSEIAFFNKPAILIPLGKGASRGDQLVNADVFATAHKAVVLREGTFTGADFLREVDRLLKFSGRKQADSLRSTGAQGSFEANDKIIKIITSYENRD